MCHETKNVIIAMLVHIWRYFKDRNYRWCLSGKRQWRKYVNEKVIHSVWYFFANFVMFWLENVCDENMSKKTVIQINLILYWPITCLILKTVKWITTITKNFINIISDNYIFRNYCQYVYSFLILCIIITILLISKIKNMLWRNIQQSMF